MKNNIKFMLLFVAMLLFGFSARAGSKMAINDESTTQTYDITVNVETMGTFSDALSAAMAEAGCENVADISRLTVTGNVNNEDLNYLRDNVGATLYALDMGAVTVENNTLGNYALRNCGFSELILPNSVENIGWRALEDCSNLKTLDIPSSVKSIDDGFCQNAKSLETVTGGENVTGALGACFINCPNLKSPVFFNNILVRLPESTIGAYEVPESVTSIAGWAMSNIVGLTSVKIGNGVASIPSGFAYGCNNLEEVTIGKSVSSIGSNAFCATNIKNVYCLGKIPPVWEVWENRWDKSFYGDINPEAVLHVYSNFVSRYENSNGWKDFPTIVGDLGEYQTYDITVNVETMGTFSDALLAAMAEAGCENMADISRLTVTGNVNNEDLNYLSDNVGATLAILDMGAVTVENNTLGNYALRNCGFSELILPNSVENIGWNALGDCSNLKTLDIPSSVKSIGSGFCQNAKSLETVTGGENVTGSLGACFYHCPNLKSPVFFNNILVRLPESTIGAYEVPESVTSIADGAMSNIVGLTSVKIGNGVTSIPYGFAIYSDNLEEVTIGKSVSSIGSNAFCATNIKNVYCLGKIPPVWEVWENRWDKSFYDDINPEAVLHVHSNCVSLYENSDGWKDFPTIVGDLGEYQTYDITVNVETMGTFSEALDAAMAEAGCDYMCDICRLTVTGNVNNDDLNYLRDNVGATLEALDLGAVTVESNTLGYNALSNCLFSEFVLPNSVENIGWLVLVDCFNLKTLDIPSSVKSIGLCFCENAKSLETVTGGENVTGSVGVCFNNCPNLKSPVFFNNILVRLPENTVGIYKVPENVTCIRQDAMAQVPGLTSLILPESITEIGYEVLGGDENLRDIYFYATELPVTDNTFNNFNQASCTLHVFANMVEAFQNDVSWSDFNIVGDLDEISEKLVTNKYDMSKGWNWVSTNIATDAAPFIKPIDDMVSRLVSQTDELVNDPEYGLVGTLNSLDVAAGYKLQTTDVAAFEHYGMVTIPSEQSVQLSNGWNWIGYLPIQTLPVGDALNNLQAAVGDRLISQNGFAVYGANGWEGDLQVMNPGEGYMYYRAADETAFNYPDKSAENQGASLNAMKYASQDSGNGSPWTYDIHSYPDVTTIIAKLYVEDRPVDLANYSVGVFCGQECRGVAKQVGDKLFITVHGTIKDEETISFLAYEHASGETLPVNETITFQGQVLGELTNPMALHIQSETTSISDISVLSDVRAIYSPTGKRVNSLQQGVNIVVYADGTTRKVIVTLDR